MIEVAKLGIIFIIYVFVCEIAGQTILNRLKINVHIIAIPIGIVLFGCIYELLIIIPQLFFLDSKLLKWMFLLTIILLFVFGRKEIKHIFVKLSRKDIILLLLFICLVVIKTIDLNVYGIDQETGDNLFYIPALSGVAMDGVPINGFGSMLCIAEKNLNAHAFYGHIHMLGGIANLLGVQPLLTINFFQVWFITLFHLTNIYNIYICCYEYGILHNINKYFVFIFILLFYIPALSSRTVVFVDTIAVIYIVFPLLCYIKSNKKNWLFIFVLFSFYSTTIRSSFIFVIAFFLLFYYSYLFFSGRFDVKDNVLILIPTLFSLWLYFVYGKNYSILIISFLLLVVAIVCLLFIGKINILYLKRFYFLLLICIFAFLLVDSLVVGNHVSTWDGVSIFEELYSNFFNYSSISSAVNSITNTSYLILGSIVFVLSFIKNNKISYIGLHVVGLFIFCLNPLVAPAISKMITQVYSRLFWAWINPFFILLLIDESLDLMKTNIAERAICIVLILLLVISNVLFYSTSFAVHSKDTINRFKNDRENLSLYYKVGKNSYEIGLIIDQYAKDKDLDFVYVDLPLQIVNSTFMSRHIRLSSNMGTYGTINSFIYSDYYTQMWNENKYPWPMYFYLSEPYRYFDDWKFERDLDNVPKLEQLFKENHVDVFVIAKWERREETCYHLVDYLKSFSTMLYENDNYQVYAID